MKQPKLYSLDGVVGSTKSDKKWREIFTNVSEANTFRVTSSKVRHWGKVRQFIFYR